MVLRNRSSELGDAPLRTALATMQRASAAPGLSVAVVRPEGVVYNDAIGLADVAHRVPCSPQTAYLWFSVTKIVTATAAMRLADEGRLDLNAPCHEYVDHPVLRARSVPTTRQLLTHAAGLDNPVPIRWVRPAETPAPDPRELLRHLLDRRHARRWPANSRTHYSNVGYLLAAEVISAAAGIPFEQYALQAVLTPVGISNTGFTYPSHSTVATGYVRAPRIADPLLRRVLPKGVIGIRSGRDLAFAPFLVDGAGYGGLVGPVLDAGRLLRLHLCDGELDGVRVLSAAAARQMRAIVASNRSFAHGTGWFRRLNQPGQGDFVEHLGAGAGFWNVIRIYPDRGLGIAVLSNGTRSLDLAPLLDRIDELD